MATLADIFSWSSFEELLYNGYQNLQLPSSDNQSLILDMVLYHAAADPLIFAIRSSFVIAFACWFMSMASGTHSWIDRIWSIAPIFYAVHYSVRDLLYWPADVAFIHQPRVYLATLLISLWGIRLTYNFYRKGGYSLDNEDYRWPYLASKIPMGAWFLFNIVFICLFQSLLLVALTSPVYLAWRTTFARIPQNLNWIDGVATILFLAGLWLESTADNQQWAFQEAKRLKIKNKEELTGDFKRGFLTKDLFSFSRHPNFVGEMIVWWSVYLFSVAAGFPTYISWINPTIVGPISLTILFQITTTLTEYLTKKKYPSYKLYQQTTSRLIPLGAGQDLDELEAQLARKSQ